MCLATCKCMLLCLKCHGHSSFSLSFSISLSLQDPAAMVIDHSVYSVSAIEGDHTLIASDDFIKSEVILGSKKIEASALLFTH